MHCIARRISARLLAAATYASCVAENALRPFPRLRIVTGANAPYAKVLLRLLGTLKRHEPATPTTVFDLGLEEGQRDAIRRLCPAADICRFDFSAEPSWFDLRVNAGSYAWKPVIIDRILEHSQGDVLWLDASVVLREPLLRIRRELRRHGVYAPRWPGVTARSLTHPDTIAYLHGDGFVDADMLIAAVVGIAYSHPVARRLAQEWASCARARQCIAPAGAAPPTHKFDQSVLSILAGRYGLSADGARECLGFFIDNIRANWEAL